MSKEKMNQMIGDAYKKFKTESDWLEQTNHLRSNEFFNDDLRILSQEEFINKCKTDSEFSERWGLKIEERELSVVERMEYYGKHLMKETDSKTFDELCQIDYDKLNIPTKLITITYNNETIESYE